MWYRYRLTLGKVAELEDALQRERVDKVERLQVSAGSAALSLVVLC